MRWSLLIPYLMMTGFALTSASSCADVLANCYKEAENRVQVRQCLQKELEATQREYLSVLDRVSKEVSAIEQAADGLQKRKKAGAMQPNAVSRTFSNSNKAFDAYMKQQCAFEAMAMEPDTGAGNQRMACQITLLRLRMGALNSFIPTDVSSSSRR